MGGFTSATKAAHRSWRSILSTPALAFGDVPLVAFAVGQPEGWVWSLRDRLPPDQRCHNHARRLGYVYFADASNGLWKVGFTAQPVDRMVQLRLRPALYLADVQPKHERLIHTLLASERVRGELFAGDRVDAFVRLALGRSRCSVLDTKPYDYRISRMRLGEAS